MSLSWKPALRRLLWRLGRRLYLRARGEVPNRMAGNGEWRLQAWVLALGFPVGFQLFLGRHRQIEHLLFGGVGKIPQDGAG